MVVSFIEIEKINSLLKQVHDPEVPVLNILEMGILRKVYLNENNIEIIITPTYSGCPAMNQIEKNIDSILKKNGINNFIIRTVLSPAWTTDWLTDEALKKLEDYGIAPPVKGSADKGVLFSNGPKMVKCPQCKSFDTEMISQFGSTACKALYRCNNCDEPFDYFKCL